MDPERWQEVKELFDRTLERAPEERERFLSSATAGDAELRQEVRSLLRALDRLGDRFERPAAEQVRDLLGRDLGADRIGRRVGAYRLVRELGRGGMGVVYEALRDDGQYEQRVAIKIVRWGLDSERLIRRFRREQQILAQLDHPRIAMLLDGGVTPDGLPYFAMEYVDGLPLDDYCDVHRLPVKERLTLFRDVCEAVQFAHQNLVVHRDLKPSNILVTADGTAKLLDFGIAKLLRDEGSLAVLTLTGTVWAMTPEYASPEQLGGGPITTASDVYSLGVILYRLLAGAPPYRLEGRSLPEIARVVCDEEPPRLSTAVAEGAAARARERTTGHLRRRLAGELDDMVGMALRKEPQRRYASAAQLAEDLDRYLDGRPLIAGRDSALYRAKKFVRRHAVGVVATAVVLVALIGGMLATSWQARRAERQRALAEQRLEDVRGLARTLLFDVHDAIADLPGATQARTLLVEQGIEYLDRLAEQVGVDPELGWEVAEAYIRLGQARGQPAGASAGDLAGARQSYERALSVAGRLVASKPDDRRARRTLALAHEKLGDVRAYGGDVVAGVEHAREALRGYRTLVEQEPGSGAARLSLAISHIKLGDLLGNPNFPNLDDSGAAMAEYRRALDLLATPPLQGRDGFTKRRYEGLIHERIATMLRIEGRTRESLAGFQRSLEIRERLAEANPSSTNALRDVGVTHTNLCLGHLELGRTDPALERCRDALEVYERLAATDPNNVQSLRDLATGHRALYEVMAARNQWDAALVELDRSIELLQRLLEIEPENVYDRRELAQNRLRAAVAHARLARVERADDRSGASERWRRSESSYERGRSELLELRGAGASSDEDTEFLRQIEERLARIRAAR